MLFFYLLKLLTTKSCKNRAMNEISKSVLKFAQLMQYKLDKNKFKESKEMNPDGKGRTWKRCSVDWLLTRIYDELVELNDAVERKKSNREIQEECADVANFAMMIFDKLNESHE